MIACQEALLSSSYGGGTPSKNRARACLTLREGDLWRSLSGRPQGLALMLAGTGGDLRGLKLPGVVPKFAR